jgi:uncharacterized phage-like protein YoqJ
LAKVVTVSGYKAFELGIFKQSHPAVSYIKKAIRKDLQDLVEEGLEWVVISGALGTELWAAEVVYEMQESDGIDLKVAIITPFLDQESKWSEQNKEWYESVLIQADFIDSVSRKPYEKPWQLRLKNQFLIEKSDVLLLFYDVEKEGSPKFLLENAKKYQQEHEYEIRFIQFYDIQMIVEEEQWNDEGF